MSCKYCKTNPVIELTNNNKKLCKSCFTRYFERKVRKTIRLYKLIDKNDKIGVGVSGGKDSLTLLYLLNNIFKNTKTKIIAISIDEGIKGYRDKALEKTKEFCKKNNIELHIYSYKKEFNKNLDDMVKKTDKVPCSYCGVFRRYLLNKAAKELKLTKLATGHNLDDEAQTILMNQFRSNPELNARQGPISGVNSIDDFVPRIKPLYMLTEKEVMTFAFIHNLTTDFNECPHGKQAYRNEVRELVNNFEAKFPGSKHALVSSFLEILPSLKSKYKNYKELNKCKICKQSTSQEICMACKYKEMFK